MRLVAVVGSAVRSGKTRIAVETVVRSAVDSEPDLETDIIDLAMDHVPILDGKSQLESNELAQTML